MEEEKLHHDEEDFSFLAFQNSKTLRDSTETFAAPPACFFGGFLSKVLNLTEM